MKKILSKCLSFALLAVLMMTPMQAFAADGNYNYKASVQFVDEDGNPVSGGVFQSSWPWVEYYSSYSESDGSGEYPKISSRADCSPTYTLDTPGHKYATGESIVVESYKKVEEPKKYVRFEETREESARGTLKEIQTPEGYAPIKGTLEVDLKADKSGAEARIVRDETGKAYAKDKNTIYIVYHKYTQAELDAMKPESKPETKPESKPAKEPELTVTVEPVKKKVPVKIQISSVKGAKKAITVKWKKPSKKNLKKIDGYQVQISKNKNFKKAKMYKSGKDKTSKQIKKLSKKTKYYVRMRTYKGKTYGAWSKVTNVKTK